MSPFATLIDPPHIVPSGGRLVLEGRNRTMRRDNIASALPDYAGQHRELIYQWLAAHPHLKFLANEIRIDGLSVWAIATHCSTLAQQKRIRRVSVKGRKHTQWRYYVNTP